MALRYVEVEMIHGDCEMLELSCFRVTMKYVRSELRYVWAELIRGDSEKC